MCSTSKSDAPDIFRGNGRPSDTRECVEDVVDGEDITVIVDSGIMTVNMAEGYAGLKGKGSRPQNGRGSG